MKNGTGVKGQEVAYVRVSTEEQSTDRQFADCAIQFAKTFEEKTSAGKGAKRPVFDTCVQYLREGDCLHVWSLDRLARGLQDLLDIVGTLNSKGVTVRFHSENMTFAPGGSDPMADFQLHILGAVAQLERSLIRKRQREGIDVALAKGKRWGRKQTLTPEQIEEIKSAVAARVPQKELEAKYNVSRQTIYRHAVQGQSQVSA